MARHRLLSIIALLLLVITLASGCARDHDFNEQVEEIVEPYRFELGKWEIKTLAGEIREAFRGKDDQETDTIQEMVTYFTHAEQIQNLEATLNAVRAGNLEGDADRLQNEIDERQRQNEERSEAAEKAIEVQIRKALTEQGILNPLDRHIEIRLGFPPVKIYLGNPPHVLIVSPRDKIETIKDIKLLPVMSLEDKEKIEAEVDKLGVSSLVEGLGGLSTYPSYVNDKFGFKFAVQTAVHEWMHQYLFFTPLGIRYTLDQTGIRPDYEIATINETVAGIVSKEIGDIIYKKCFPQEVESTPLPTNGSSFDFNKEMRETRRAVDSLLARGEIEQAEAYMEQRRLYLAQNGYYIRRLNQAYFAFYGTYADSPTSISPIGEELKKLREQSNSLKEFLDSAAGIKSREELTELLK